MYLEMSQHEGMYRMFCDVTHRMRRQSSHPEPRRVVPVSASHCVVKEVRVVRFGRSSVEERLTVPAGGDEGLETQILAIFEVHSQVHES
jgi:hypothetical protein